MSQLKQLSNLAEPLAQATLVLDRVRGLMLSPAASKKPPIYTVRELAALCGVETEYLTYRIKQGDKPAGLVAQGGRRRMFSLVEARQWIKALRVNPPRPNGQRAATIAIGNFKGGVSKTTTTMTIAQGLSLRGYDVLVVDLDPQGSLTTLFGVIPDTEVDEEATVLPLILNKESDLKYAVHESYWDGLDFIPAQPQLFTAEFLLPSRQMNEKGFEFWRTLDDGLMPLREMYDVILIDTAPALSYLTINAFMAADGLLIPLPPSALDFASSVSFWALFSDLANQLNLRTENPKTFDFMNILLTRVDRNDEAANAVKEWILAAYPDRVLPVEIPRTAVASTASAGFGTAYDISNYEGDKRTYRRARDAYDKLAETIDEMLMERWGVETTPDDTNKVVPVEPD